MTSETRKRKAIHPLIWILIIAGIGLGIYAKLNKVAIDRWFFQEIFPMTHEYRVQMIMRFLSFIGGGKFLVPFVPVLIFLLVKLTKVVPKAWSLIIMSSLGVYMENWLIKFLFQRVRPEDFMVVEQGGYSYPSGHTMVNICLWLTIAWLLTREYRDYRTVFYVLAVLLAGAIAISRPLLGVHWPTDIIGGVLFGVAFYSIHTYIWQRYIADEKENFL